MANKYLDLTGLEQFLKKLDVVVDLGTPTFSQGQASFTITEEQFNSLLGARRGALTFSDINNQKYILVKISEYDSTLRFMYPSTGTSYVGTCTLTSGTQTASGTLTETSFSDLYQSKDSKLTSIASLPNNQTGVIKITNGVASLEESLTGLMVDLGTLTFTNNVATFTVTQTQYTQLHAAETAAIKFTTDGDTYILNKAGLGSDYVMFSLSVGTIIYVGDIASSLQGTIVLYAYGDIFLSKIDDNVVEGHNFTIKSEDITTSTPNPVQNGFIASQDFDTATTGTDTTKIIPDKVEIKHSIDDSGTIRTATTEYQNGQIKVSTNNAAGGTDINATINLPQTSGTLALTSDIPSAPVQDVQIDGTSILSGTTAYIVTETAYDASTNKIATMADLPAEITINTTSGSESVSDGTHTLSFGSNAFADTPIPTTYLKNASVSNNVLTITKQDNTTETFTDTTYESKSAASGGTDVSLVTTGEKYLWDNKQDALAAQTPYSAVGGSTQIPVITTNNLGQVTSITTATVTSANDAKLTINGATSSDKIEFTANQATDVNGTIDRTFVGLGSVVNTGDSATPVENGLTKFTTGGAYAMRSALETMIKTQAAHFRGSWDNWTSVPSDPTLYPSDPLGDTTPTANDYMILVDASGYPVGQGEDPLSGSWRFIYTGDWSTDGKNGWEAAYAIDAQLSGILDSISNLPTSATGLIKLTSGVASLDQTSYAASSDLEALENNLATIAYESARNTTAGTPTVLAITVTDDDDVVSYNLGYGAGTGLTANDANKTLGLSVTGVTQGTYNNVTVDSYGRVTSGSNTSYLTGITSTDVTTALGYTPYNSANPNGYISSITSSMITTALGYTPADEDDIPAEVTESTVSGWGFTKNTGTITKVQLNGIDVASSGVANVKALPNYSVNLGSTNGGNPRPALFMTVNYTNMTSSASAYMKLGMMSCHGNGSAYKFMQDVMINVTSTGTVGCTVYKHTTSNYGTWNSRNCDYGDIFWTIDTTNKIVSFYVLLGQYSSMNMTPPTYIGLATYSAGTSQKSGTPTYYSSGDINWATIGSYVTNTDPTFIGIVDTTGATLKLRTINAPTSSGGTTYGPGSSGQVLKSNGTTMYWANDSYSTAYLSYTQTSGTTSTSYYKLVGKTTSLGSSSSTNYGNNNVYFDGLGNLVATSFKLNGSATSSLPAATDPVASITYDSTNHCIIFNVN